MSRCELSPLRVPQVGLLEAHISGLGPLRLSRRQFLKLAGAAGAGAAILGPGCTSRRPTVGGAEHRTTKEVYATQLVTMAEIKGLGTADLFERIESTNQALEGMSLRTLEDASSEQQDEYLIHAGNLMRLLTGLLARHHQEGESLTQGPSQIASSRLVEDFRQLQTTLDEQELSNQFDGVLRIDSFETTLGSLVFAWYQYALAQKTVGYPNWARTSYRSTQEIAEAYLERQQVSFNQFLDEGGDLFALGRLGADTTAVDPFYTLWVMSLRDQVRTALGEQEGAGLASFTLISHQFLSQKSSEIGAFSAITDLETFHQRLTAFFNLDAIGDDPFLRSDPFARALFKRENPDQSSFEDFMHAERRFLIDEIVWGRTVTIDGQLRVNVGSIENPDQAVYLSLDQFMRMLIRNGGINKYPPEVEKAIWAAAVRGEADDLSFYRDGVAAGQVPIYHVKAGINLKDLSRADVDDTGKFLEPGDRVPFIDLERLGRGSLIPFVGQEFVIFPQLDGSSLAVALEDLITVEHTGRADFFRKSHQIVWWWLLYGMTPRVSLGSRPKTMEEAMLLVVHGQVKYPDAYPIIGGLQKKLVGEGFSGEAAWAIAEYLSGHTAYNAIQGDVKILTEVGKGVFQILKEQLRKAGVFIP